MGKFGRSYDTIRRVVDLGNFNSAVAAQGFQICLNVQNIFIALDGTPDTTTVSITSSTDITDNWKQYRIRKMGIKFIPHVNVNEAVSASASLGLIYTGLEQFVLDDNPTEGELETDRTARIRDWSKPWFEWVPLYNIVPVLDNKNDTSITLNVTETDLADVLAFVRVPSMWLDTSENLVRHYAYNIVMNATTTAADVAFRGIAYVYVDVRYPV